MVGLARRGGRLSLRLPSQGPEVMDSVSWHDGMQGPWWWKEIGWSWRRMGTGPREWTPSSDGGSPGGSIDWSQWTAPATAHRCPYSSDMMACPLCGGGFLSGSRRVAAHGPVAGGTIVHSRSLDMQEQEGEWTWDGMDAQGVPVPPGC